MEAGGGGLLCSNTVYIDYSWSFLIMARNKLYVLHAEDYHFCNLNKNRKV